MYMRLYFILSHLTANYFKIPEFLCLSVRQGFAASGMTFVDKGTPSFLHIQESPFVFMAKKQIRISYFVLFFICISFPLLGFGQKTMSLDDCIQYGLEKNIDILQASNNEKIAYEQHQQTKRDLLPIINSDITPNYNIGYTIDPTTYAFSNTNSISASATLNAQLILFQGMQEFNKITKSKYEWKSSVENQKANRINYTINLTNAYLQSLVIKENQLLANNQRQIAKEKLHQINKKITLGFLPKGDQYEAEAQLATEEVNVIKQENAYELSILRLKQIMRFPQDSILRIDSASESLEKYIMANSPSDINLNVEELPNMKVQFFNLKALEKKLAISQGSLMPAIVLDYAVGSNFINTARNIEKIRVTGAPIGYLQGNEGQTVLAFPQEYSIQGDKTPIFEQFSNNLQHRISLSARFSIFSKFSKRSQIHLDRLSIKNQELELIKNKQKITEELQNVKINILNAQKIYEASLKNEKANEIAYEFAKEKNAKGLLSDMELQITRRNYYNAQLETNKSKYDWIFKARLLQIYSDHNAQGY